MGYNLTPLKHYTEVHEIPLRKLHLPYKLLIRRLNCDFKHSCL